MISIFINPGKQCQICYTIATIGILIVTPKIVNMKEQCYPEVRAGHDENFLNESCTGQAPP